MKAATKALLKEQQELDAMAVTIRCTHCGLDACGHTCKCPSYDGQHRYCCWCGKCYEVAKTEVPT